MTDFRAVPHFKNESALKSFCADFAAFMDVLAYPFRSPQNKGVMDWLYIFPGGSVVFIEFKHPNGKGVLSPLQVEKIKTFRAQGATCYVCYRFVQFKTIVAYHLKRAATARD